MAKLLFSNTSVSSSSSVSFSYQRTRTFASTINEPKIQFFPRLPDLNKGLVAKLNLSNNFTPSTTIAPNHIKDDPFCSTLNDSSKKSVLQTSTMEVAKLHLILEIVSDRVEMHSNIGSQRDNWNHLLLSSVNMMTLSAATMAGFAAVSGTKASLLALKLSSTVLYIAATGILVVMNKIQPSQLAEEQRQAARLFKQLQRNLRTRLSLGDDYPTEEDVNEAMEKVLALDKAYPLPLLGSMLEKFPKKVEPARWWPPLKLQRHGKLLKGNNNGWDGKLEEEMKEIVRVLKRKEMGDYVGMSEKVLNFNKVLAVSGPLLTGIAALGSAFVGGSLSWPVMVGVIGGALASVVNTIEHGGQMGMVFEMYRGDSGFLKLMEESIEMNIKEEEVDRRENGELLEIKVALQLGMSVSKLRELASSSSSSEDKEKACDD